MTPFASVAIFIRDGGTIFRAPRREVPTDHAQARKTAMRYWRTRCRAGERLGRVFILREHNGILDVSERIETVRGWRRDQREIGAGAKDPHLKACMDLLGIDADNAATMPDVLTINGFTYRREI